MSYDKELDFDSNFRVLTNVLFKWMKEMKENARAGMVGGKAQVHLKSGCKVQPECGDSVINPEGSEVSCYEDSVMEGNTGDVVDDNGNERKRKRGITKSPIKKSSPTTRQTRRS